jgi:ferredoxin-NADP reductase
MKLFKAEFIENIIRTEDTESFRFIPEEKISFLPGQFLKLIFDEDSLDNRELNKYLSFSCSPHREYIGISAGSLWQLYF